MPESSPFLLVFIMEIDLTTDLITGTNEVFSTMVMMNISSESSGEDKNIVRSNITSMLGLGGDIKGILAVHCSENVALRITSSFLGMDVASLDEDVKDALGEIANMIAGHIKSVLAEKGLKTELAIPASIIGKSFRMSGFLKAKRTVVPFSTDYGPFWVEISFMKNK